MKISLVTTTINIPYLLEDYAKDAKKYGYKNFNIIVMGDKKTPIEVDEFCRNLSKQENIPVNYYDPDAQIKYIKKYPELDNFLPWNCIQRRNLAILMAYEQGSDIIVTIDDDNYLAQENYMSGHHSVGKHGKLFTISSSTGWFNICEYLEEIQNRKFYPRGYPVSERGKDANNIQEKQKNGRIIVNGGFWLGDPDIDAVTRLAAPIDVIGYTRNNNFALDINTWAPFNSQNTALHRDCLPAYFLCPNIGRFDDIWASYIVKRIADHLGDYISFGFPLVRQNRNPHDLWIDADHERFGMQLSDLFCNWLREIVLTHNNYHSCTVELLEWLKNKLDNSTLHYQHRAYINHFIDGYRVWLKTMHRVHLLTFKTEAMV